MRRMVPRTVAIRSEHPARAWGSTGRPARSSRSSSTCAINSADAMPDGGELFDLGSFGRHQSAVLEVRDTGEGMDERRRWSRRWIRSSPPSRGGGEPGWGWPRSIEWRVITRARSPSPASVERERPSPSGCRLRCREGWSLPSDVQTSRRCRGGRWPWWSMMTRWFGLSWLDCWRPRAPRC